MIGMLITFGRSNKLLLLDSKALCIPGHFSDVCFFNPNMEVGRLLIFQWKKEKLFISYFNHKMAHP